MIVKVAGGYLFRVAMNPVSGYKIKIILNKETIPMTGKKTISIPAADSEELTTLKLISDKTGEQVSQLIFDSFKEMLDLINEKRKKRSTDHHPDELLKAGDVARILNISRGQAYQLMRTREVSTFSVGKIVRVRRSDLEEFIQAHIVR